MTPNNDPEDHSTRRPSPKGLPARTYWRIAISAVVLLAMGGSTAVLAAVVGGWIGYRVALDYERSHDA
jgi:hypothetical protein